MAEHGLDVAGVGPQRTGTTWLDACLREHPELCLPEEVKETFFLDRHFERGWDWHAGHFERCGPERLRTEVGPTWFDVPEVPGRLHERAPDCRIVATLRDPAERSWSLYRHHRRKGRVGEDYREAVEEIPRIVEASRYGEHLPRWIDRFGSERVHVILLDDVRERPEAVLEELCDSLEVAPFDEAPASAEERVYAGRRARHPSLARLAVGASRWLRDRGLHGVADLARRLTGGLVYGTPDEDEGMPPALRAELAAAFEEDVRFIEELTGRDLDRWRAP